MRTSTHAATASQTLVATILAQIFQEVPQFVPVSNAKTLKPRGHDGKSVCGAQRAIAKVMRERTSDERQQSGELHSSPSVFSACGGGRTYGPRTVWIRIVSYVTMTVCTYLERVALDTGPSSAHVFLIHLSSLNAHYTPPTILYQEHLHSHWSYTFVVSFSLLRLITKADMSSSLVAYLHQTSILFEWYVVCYGSKNGQHKSLKENQIASSKYVNHSSFNSQHILGRGGAI